MWLSLGERRKARNGLPQSGLEESVTSLAVPGRTLRVAEFVTLEWNLRHFCTAGPVLSEKHYGIPPSERVDRDEIFRLIDDWKYFILHAPRQTGKTSALLALVDELNATGRYRALYINVEGAQAARNDVGGAIRAIISIIAGQAKSRLNDPYPDEISTAIEQKSPHDGLRRLLTEWSEHSPLPICLMIDEIDALVGDSLISVLRQIRAGYEGRPKHFPQSMILCGVRDVRDYRLHVGGEVITGGSAFNIKAESLRLGDFSQADIRRLYEQHTAETGQVFEEAIYPLVWELTQGQPWLVNALAYEACFRFQKDRSKPVTPALIEQAKDSLIAKRVTHLDQLTDKLKEPRVRRVIEPIVQGEEQEAAQIENSDDAQYLIDLGLIRRGKSGLEISNGIYREVIPRELTYGLQMNFEPVQQTAWYVAPDGRLEFPKLMDAFQQFYRENSEIWLSKYEYREAGPQLLLQAFLQRIVNGGGRIDREYALGRRRTDLLISWPHPGGMQRVVIELKMVRRSVEKTIEEGLAQTSGYMDQTGAREAHLALFNKMPGVTWDEKIFRREATAANGQPVTIWGL